jgi:ribosomal protein L11 methyltransferase
MNYVSIKFNLTPFSPYAEILMTELAEIGFDSFDDNSPPLLIGYCPTNNLNKQTVTNTIKSITEINPVTIEIIEVTEHKQQNHNHIWESSFQPICINQQLIIKAPFHTNTKKYLHEIIIQPKMAFGTGHHETTYQMLEQMLSLQFNNKTVLDMGTGTGVLGILAEKLGSSEIICADIEEWSIENTKENLLLNNCIKAQVIKGDIHQIPNKLYDIILANINKNVLLKHIPYYSHLLNKGGLLLMSGFFITDLPDIINISKHNELTLHKQTNKNTWACVSFLKN